MGTDPLYLGLPGDFVTLRQVLDGEAEWLRHPGADPAAAHVLRCLGLLDADADAPESGSIAVTTEVARKAAAANRGFPDWSAATAAGDRPVDLRFEAAAEAVHWGRVEVLRSLLAGRPGLVRGRSDFPHGAMLVHCVAANGIEISRQLQSPANAVSVLEVLLEAGADPDARCEIYGPGQTALCLLVSSSVPAEAGVQGPLVEALCRGGADPDGPEGDGAPLWTAIRFGYTEAVDALVRAGATLGNAAFAAAAGDVELVGAFLAGHGSPPSPGPGSAPRPPPAGPALDPRRPLEYALIYAALHGRRAVVEDLLVRGPDLTTREPDWANTALDAARFGQHLEIAALLEEAARRRAPRPMEGTGPA